MPLILVLSALGCSFQQRAAQKLVDPRLLEQGELLERERGARDLQLGPYRVASLQLDERPLEQPEGRPTLEYELSFSLIGDARGEWDTACVGVRRQPVDHDYAAAADEPRDEVALRCVFEGPVSGAELGELVERPSWQLELSGTLADNLFAQLLPSSGGSDPGPRWQVEVLMWHRVWQVARRPLAASLATVLGPEGTQAAMILSAPERAWLAPELDEQARGLSLSVLVALRLIPLGFEL